MSEYLFHKLATRTITFIIYLHHSEALMRHFYLITKFTARSPTVQPHSSCTERNNHQINMQNGGIRKNASNKYIKSPNKRQKNVHWIIAKPKHLAKFAIGSSDIIAITFQIFTSSQRHHQVTSTFLTERVKECYGACQIKLKKHLYRTNYTKLRQNIFLHWQAFSAKQ